MTRELFDLIIELWLTVPASGLETHIKREFVRKLRQDIVLISLLELHLLKWQRRHCAYLLRVQEYIKQTQMAGAQPTLMFGRTQLYKPKGFSPPYNTVGYADNLISNDTITHIYLEFSKKTRNDESAAYLKTLTGVYVLPYTSATLLMFA